MDIVWFRREAHTDARCRRREEGRQMKQQLHHRSTVETAESSSLRAVRNDPGTGSLFFPGSEPAKIWVMRLSAKLNVYLGVPNLTEEDRRAIVAYLKDIPPQPKQR